MIIDKKKFKGWLTLVDKLQFKMKNISLFRFYLFYFFILSKENYYLFIRKTCTNLFIHIFFLYSDRMLIIFASKLKVKFFGSYDLYLTNFWCTFAVKLGQTKKILEVNGNI